MSDKDRAEAFDKLLNESGRTPNEIRAMYNLRTRSTMQRCARCQRYAFDNWILVDDQPVCVDCVATSSRPSWNVTAASVLRFVLIMTAAWIAWLAPLGLYLAWNARG